MIDKNSVFTGEITGYTHDGMGVTRFDGDTEKGSNGRVFFVRGGVRGDKAEFLVLKLSGNIGYAKIAKLITPSPYRIPSPCPAFPMCGGCDFQHMTYQEELWQKSDRVIQAFNRIAGADFLSDVTIDEMIAEPLSVHNYRNKAAFPVGFSEGKAVTGFYRERSHDIIPIDTCLLQKTSANGLMRGVREWVQLTNCRHIRHIFARNGEGGVLACVISSAKPDKNVQSLIDILRREVADLVGIVWDRNETTGNVILSGNQTVLWGKGTVEDVLRVGSAELSFEISPMSFYQINKPIAQKVYERAIEYAGSFSTALDLYCGAGTLTLCVGAMRPDSKIIGVEVVPEAIADAKAAAEKHGVSNVSFHCGDAAMYKGVHPEVVFVDPPRKGLSPEAVETVLKLTPQRVVYISCDPATLARDVRLFCGGGYSVVRLTVADMFPRTGHVETIVLLQRQTI